MYCFNNTFATDTRATKKIPLIDEVSDGETFYTFRDLNISSSASRSK